MYNKPKPNGVFDKIEPEFKAFLHRVLKGRTGAFLDYVDQMKCAPGRTIAESEELEKLKSRGKSMFMEVQDEILSGIKCLVETGSIPEGIDRRGKS